MALDYCDSLRERLASIRESNKKYNKPNNNIGEISLLERRIEAVNKGIVDGHKYKSLNELYKAIDAEVKSIQSSESRELTERFMLLNDLALQYDPSSVGRTKFLAPDKEIPPMILAQAINNYTDGKIDILTKYRHDEPNPERSNIKVPQYSDVINPLFDQSQMLGMVLHADEYEKTLTKAVVDGHLNLQYKNAYKRTKNGSYESEIVVSLPENDGKISVEGRTALGQLSETHKKMSSIQSSDPDAERTLREAQEKYIKSALFIAAANGGTPNEVKQSLSEILLNKAKQSLQSPQSVQDRGAHLPPLEQTKEPRTPLTPEDPNAMNVPEKAINIPKNLLTKAAESTVTLPERGTDVAHPESFVSHAPMIRNPMVLGA